MTLTFLQPGMKVVFNGIPHRVDLVNECRARLVPLAKRVREFIPATGPHAGQRSVFAEPLPAVNVSPDSQLEVLS